MLEESKRDVVLNPSRMRLSEYETQNWVCTAEQGTTVKDLLQPSYWAHTSANFKPYDHIEVRIDDGIWLVELLVLGCDRNWAKVHLLSEHKLTTSDVSQSQAAKHEVQWKGPHLKHCVIRLSDSEIVKEGISDKKEAYVWMANHEKAI